MSIRHLKFGRKRKGRNPRSLSSATCAQEAELSEKLDRLTALNALLNMDEKGNDVIGMDEEGQEAEPERKLADRPAERTSLKGKLSEMKARVSGIPAGRDAIDKAK